LQLTHQKQQAVNTAVLSLIG